MARPWYTTREEVKIALDFKQGAAANSFIDQQIARSCDAIDGELHRDFYPRTATLSFDWPTIQTARPWRLWLDQNDFTGAITSISSGGTTIDPTTVIPYPSWAPGLGQPYTHLELNVTSTSAWNASATWQNSIQVTCNAWGYSNAQIPAGALVAGIGTTDTQLTLAAPSCRGVGSILTIDSERMLVTERQSTTTGQTLGANLASNVASNLVQVANTALFGLYEVITIDSERMFVYDTLGSNLLVKRGWEGTPLAAHTAGATIYAPRLLTVTRGALGTTAAAHTANTTVTEHDAPGLIRQLATALSVSSLIQTRAGYPAATGRKAPQGQGGNQPAVMPSDLDDLWARAYTSFGRKARVRSA
jgi:hypothetical protein